MTKENKLEKSLTGVSDSELIKRFADATRTMLVRRIRDKKYRQAYDNALSISAERYAREQACIVPEESSEQINYGIFPGILSEDFRSVERVPDNFMSEEDPACRISRWSQVQKRRRRTNYRDNRDYAD